MDSSPRLADPPPWRPEDTGSTPPDRWPVELDAPRPADRMPPHAGEPGPAPTDPVGETTTGRLKRVFGAGRRRDADPPELIPGGLTDPAMRAIPQPPPAPPSHHQPGDQAAPWPGDQVSRPSGAPRSPSAPPRPADQTGHPADAATGPRQGSDPWLAPAGPDVDGPTPPEPGDPAAAPAGAWVAPAPPDRAGGDDHAGEGTTARLKRMFGKGRKRDRDQDSGLPELIPGGLTDPAMRAISQPPPTPSGDRQLDPPPPVGPPRPTPPPQGPAGRPADSAPTPPRPVPPTGQQPPPSAHGVARSPEPSGKPVGDPPQTPAAAHAWADETLTSLTPMASPPTNSGLTRISAPPGGFPPSPAPALRPGAEPRSPDRPGPRHHQAPEQAPQPTAAPGTSRDLTPVRGQETPTDVDRFDRTPAVRSETAPARRPDAAPERALALPPDQVEGALLPQPDRAPDVAAKPAPLAWRFSPRRRRVVVEPDAEPVVGRASELSSARAWLRRSLPSGDQAPVVVIHGPPGSGVSSLARRLAHDIGSRFPDGYLSARMSDAGRVLIPLDEQIRRWLRTLDLTDDDIPPGTAARASLLRATLSGRRVLLLLDGVLDPAQVELLRPPTGCGLIVTTREPLEWAEEQGVRTISVEPLGARDARRLLAEHVGWPRVTLEAGAARAIRRALDHNPLAISLVGAALTSGQGSRRLSSAAGELAGGGSAQPGEFALELSLAFAWRRLGAPQAHALQAIALLDLPAASTEVMSALLDVDRATVEAQLRGLVAARLLEPTGDTVVGYRMSEPVRRFARLTALESWSSRQQEEALRRAVGSYLRRAESAAHVLDAGDPARRETARAQAWFEAERPSLLAALELTPATLAGPGVRLAAALDRLLTPLGPSGDLARTREIGLVTAERASEPRLEAEFAHKLGYLHTLQGHHDTALELLERSVALADQGHEHELANLARFDLAFAYSKVRRFEEACPLLEGLQAEGLGDDVELRRLVPVNLAYVYRHLGRHDEARTLLQESLRLAREWDDANLTDFARRNLSRLDGEAADDTAGDGIAATAGGHGRGPATGELTRIRATGEFRRAATTGELGHIAATGEFPGIPVSGEHRGTAGGRTGAGAAPAGTAAPDQRGGSTPPFGTPPVDPRTRAGATDPGRRGSTPPFGTPAAGVPAGSAEGANRPGGAAGGRTGAGADRPRTPVDEPARQPAPDRNTPPIGTGGAAAPGRAGTAAGAASPPAASSGRTGAGTSRPHPSADDPTRQPAADRGSRPFAPPVAADSGAPASSADGAAGARRRGSPGVIGQLEAVVEELTSLSGAAETPRAALGRAIPRLAAARQALDEATPQAPEWRGRWRRVRGMQSALEDLVPLLDEVERATRPVEPDLEEAPDEEGGAVFGAFRRRQSGGQATGQAAPNPDPQALLGPVLERLDVKVRELDHLLEAFNADAAGDQPVREAPPVSQQLPAAGTRPRRIFDDQAQRHATGEQPAAWPAPPTAAGTPAAPAAPAGRAAGGSPPRAPSEPGAPAASSTPPAPTPRGGAGRGSSIFDAKPWQPSEEPTKPGRSAAPGDTGPHAAAPRKPAPWDASGPHGAAPRDGGPQDVAGPWDGGVPPGGAGTRDTADPWAGTVPLGGAAARDVGRRDVSGPRDAAPRDTPGPPRGATPRHATDPWGHAAPRDATAPRDAPRDSGPRGDSGPWDTAGSSGGAAPRGSAGPLDATAPRAAEPRTAAPSRNTATPWHATDPWGHAAPGAVTPSLPARTSRPASPPPTPEWAPTTAAPGSSRHQPPAAQAPAPRQPDGALDPADPAGRSAAVPPGADSGRAGRGTPPAGAPPAAPPRSTARPPGSSRQGIFDVPAGQAGARPAEAPAPAPPVPPPSTARPPGGASGDIGRSRGGVAGDRDDGPAGTGRPRHAAGTARPPGGAASPRHSVFDDARPTGGAADPPAAPPARSPTRPPGTPAWPDPEPEAEEHTPRPTPPRR